LARDVPKNTAGLRIQVTAANRMLIDALTELAARFDLRGGRMSQRHRITA
jgi:hypothetical protein